MLVSRDKGLDAGRGGVTAFAIVTWSLHRGRHICILCAVCSSAQARRIGAVDVHFARRLDEAKRCGGGRWQMRLLPWAALATIVYQHHGVAASLSHPLRFTGLDDIRQHTKFEEGSTQYTFATTKYLRLNHTVSSLPSTWIFNPSKPVSSTSRSATRTMNTL